jgi:hypothetical protein
MTSKTLGAPAGGPSFIRTAGGYLCSTCQTPATAKVLTRENDMDLGGPVPPQLRILTDFEEMLVARVHPLVQVYTLLPSGQCAYVGHVVNYRQRAMEWVSELPLRPQDVPIVLVRRRTKEASGTSGRRAPFPVRPQALREAVLWLAANHPQYHDVTLQEDHVAAWCMEAEFAVHEVEPPEEVHVAREVFCDWIDNAAFTCAVQMREALSSAEANLERAADSGDAPPPEGHRPLALWDFLRRQLAHARDAQRYRAAECLLATDLAEFLGLESDRREILLAELLTVMEARGAEEPVEGAGALEQDLEQEARGCDEVARRQVVDDLAAALGHQVEDGEPPQGEASARSALTSRAAPQPLGARGQQPQPSQYQHDTESRAADAGLGITDEARRQAPRKDLPQKGDAVREDDIGLATAAFPAIFPYGLADCNAARPIRVTFDVWARHVLLFRDHRAMRHKRFRYWAFNTLQRRRAAQLREVYFRQNPGDRDLTFEMLETKEPATVQVGPARGCSRGRVSTILSKNQHTHKLGPT